VTVRWTTAFLDFPSAAFEAGTTFWQGVTAWALSRPRGSSLEFATLVPASGDAFLRAQRTGGSSARCHLDLHVERVDETAEQAVRLGATVVGEPGGIVVMASPGGLPLCMVSHRGEVRRPPATLWPGGYHGLVDQVCLDVPPGVYAEESAFWAALTGWGRRSGARPEFEHLVRPPGMPLRLLLQRLDDDSSARCRSHLDLACEDVEAEVRRHEALGAGVVRVMPGWTTLVDPAGCFTASPAGIRAGGRSKRWRSRQSASSGAGFCAPGHSCGNRVKQWHRPHQP
jgi:predicted enzyme related to lactoylglutathione lyase